MNELTISIVAIIIAGISLFISLLSYISQRKHNRVKFKPHPNLKIDWLENSLKVEFSNTGLGPLIITEFVAFSRRLRSKNLIDIIPFDPPDKFKWDYCIVDMKDYSLTPNQAIVLLHIHNENSHEVDEELQDFIYDLREFLSETKIEIQFKDVYGVKSKVECDLKDMT